jgi:hypothetical protein
MQNRRSENMCTHGQMYACTFTSIQRPSFCTHTYWLSWYKAFSQNCIHVHTWNMYHANTYARTRLHITYTHQIHLEHTLVYVLCGIIILGEILEQSRIPAHTTNRMGILGISQAIQAVLSLFLQRHHLCSTTWMRVRLPIPQTPAVHPILQTPAVYPIPQTHAVSNLGKAIFRYSCSF